MAKAKTKSAKGKAGKNGTASKAGKQGKDPGSRRAPKKKCCVSSTKCDRCPLRMLKEGTLPPGYTVKKRRLVSLPDAA
jgi:hypothetical protein